MANFGMLGGANSYKGYTVIKEINGDNSKTYKQVFNELFPFAKSDIVQRNINTASILIIDVSTGLASRAYICIGMSTTTIQFSRASISGNVTNGKIQLSRIRITETDSTYWEITGTDAPVDSSNNIVSSNTKIQLVV